MDIEKTLEEIKQTARREKNRDLKPIPFEFYNTAIEASHKLEDEMMRIGRPRSVEYKMIEDELSGLVTDVETVFMKRAGKIVERATSGAFTNSKNALLKKDADKLIPAEQELYEDVLKAILKARTALIAELVDTDSETAEKSPASEKKAGQMPISEKEKVVPKPEKTANPVEKSADLKSDSQKQNSLETSANVINENYVVVRILKDLPEFMGEDKRTYQLRAQDEVHLPAANANLLIKRGVALGIPGSSEGNPKS